MAQSDISSGCCAKRNSRLTRSEHDTQQLASHSIYEHQRKLEIARDDWTLLDPSGEPSPASTKSWAARRTANGIGYQQTERNGGTGFAATGREAREACEARLPETMRD